MIRALCRVERTEGGPVSLGLVEAEGVRVVPGLDLSGLLTGVADTKQLRAELDEHAADGELIPMAIVERGRGMGLPHLLAPVDQQECWGAGCTYKVGEKDLEVMRVERPLYAATYEADRPMLFFKGNARAVVGPGGSIACRVRAERTIPEAELALLLAPSGSILAFTLANDVTALDLEQRNSLYQPQAKVFDGGVALGPWWTLADAAGDSSDGPVYVRRGAVRSHSARAAHRSGSARPPPGGPGRLAVRGGLIPTRGGAHDWRRRGSPAGLRSGWRRRSNYHPSRPG